MTTSLPRGWAWVTVSDLVSSRDDLTDGPFGSNLKTEHYRESGPRVIRLQNVGDGRFLNDEAHIATTHFMRLRKHEARAGDVVVAMLGSGLPRACLVPVSLGLAIVKADCVRLRPDTCIVDGKYIVAGLNSAVVRRQAEPLVHGVGRPRLGLKWFRTLRFPLAPPAEQRRIVDALDSHLSRLDAATVSLERAQIRLQAYRTSVLKAAVEGRLVPTEAKLARQNSSTYESSAMLLARILQERRRRWEETEFARVKATGKRPKDGKWKNRYVEPAPPRTDRLPNLPEGWCWTTLEQLSWQIRNGHSAPPREAEGVRTLRISAVRPLAVDFGDVRYLPGQPEHYADDLVAVDDLLFTRYNGTPALVGVCGRVRWLEQPTVHPDKLIRVRLCPGTDPAFLEIAANSGESRRHVERRTRTTAGQAGVSGADLRQMPVPLPPYHEQIRISSAAEVLLSTHMKTRDELDVAVRRCGRLRQAVLSWAFEGKLVDQDPDNEPADALMARLRAKRSATPARKRRPRTSKAAS